MSISKFLIVAALSFCSLGNLPATESAKHSKQHFVDERIVSTTKDGGVKSQRLKKVYVGRHPVKVIEEGIIVTKGKHIFLVKAVRVDQNGLFFLKKDRVAPRMKTSSRDKSAGFLVCKTCGRIFGSHEALLWHILEKHT
jgi:hypothetical protein